ncbi:MAG: amidohydrolase [Dehalococcoidia bacterium]|nr:amidohydrolase [Dehalococcoidia bacterium]
MKGIPTIDCMMGLHEGGEAAMLRKWLEQGLLRDEESKSYVQPAEHFFKGSRDAIERGAMLKDIIALMDEVGVEKGLVGVSVEDDHGPNLEVIEQYPDRFFGYVHLNPYFGMDHVSKLEKLVKNHSGIKAESVCAFEIQRPYSDNMYYPVYAKCVELDIPIILYAGMPGPRVPGDCQNPMYLDEVCWFFPELRVVMRHGGMPWEAVCISLMLKWPNLYYSTSAMVPKYIPKDIIHYANTRGKDQVMYAGYYPYIDFHVLKNGVEELPLRDHIWPKFLRENAVRVFKL